MQWKRDQKMTHQSGEEVGDNDAELERIATLLVCNKNKIFN
jgi:hypothetical protein